MKMSYYKTSLLKKLSLAFFVLLFLSTGASFAQEDTEAVAGTEAETEEVAADTTKKSGDFWDKLKWGPKGGITLSNFWNDSEGTTDTRAGFVAGMSAGIPFMDWLEFGVEVLYSRQGGNDVPERLFYNDDARVWAGHTRNEMDLILHTVEIPVLFTYYVPMGQDPYVKPMITLGHSFGFNAYASSKSKWTKDSTGETFEASDNVTERVKAQNFAIIGGLGVEWKHEHWPIWYTAELRYRLGYSDVSNINAKRDNIHFTDDYNNNVISFCLGIKF